MTQIRGIDISHYQDYPDYSKLENYGLGFAYIKASQANFDDPLFSKHASGLEKTHLLTGYYHFFDPKVGALTQAGRFQNTIKPFMNDYTLPPMIDLEINQKSLSPTGYIDAVRFFIDTVKEGLGIDKFFIYTGRYYWADNLGNDKSLAKDALLWDAEYLKAPGKPFGGWPEITIWQYSDNGMIENIQTDMDYFNGTAHDLGGLIKATTFKGGLSSSEWVEKYNVKIY